MGRWRRASVDRFRCMRDAAGDGEDGWTRHASGALSAAGGIAGEDLRDWPPAGAVAIELDGLYERVAEAGLLYGDAFRGLRAVYQRGEELFAQVELPETVSQEASRFGVAPCAARCLVARASGDASAGCGRCTSFCLERRAAAGARGVGHCACGCRAGGWRKAASLCCWPTRPASRLARCRRCVPGLRWPARSAARRRVRDALYRVDWSVLPALSAVASSTT